MSVLTHDHVLQKWCKEGERSFIQSKAVGAAAAGAAEAAALFSLLIKYSYR